MLHLLHFLYDNSLDKQLYCVLPAADGELQLSWRADEAMHWEVRQIDAGPAEQVPRSRLIAYLTERGADLGMLERELGSLVAANIVVADQLLAAADRAFGTERVDIVLSGQQSFARELRQTLSTLLPPQTSNSPLPPRRLKLVR